MLNSNTISFEKCAISCSLDRKESLEAFLLLLPDELETGHGRELHAAMTRMKENGTAVDPDEAAQQLMAELSKMETTRIHTVSASQATIAFLEKLEKKTAARRAYFGIRLLDELLCGVFGGKLVVVGARPSTGKSAPALKAALVTQREEHLLFCTFEMLPEKIIDRALAHLSGVNTQNIAYWTLSREESQT